MKIQHLHIYSANLSKQEQFYREVLELPIRKIASDQLEMQLGYSKLIIEERKEAKPYHFAFHISASKEEQALAWIKKRLKVLKLGENELIDFKSWNALSVYVYDADKNIVEFIARRHMHKSKHGDFSPKQDIWGIAEIGLSVQNVATTFDEIKDKTGLEKFGGNLDDFCPIGNHKGLFITVDQNQKTWFPTSDRSQNAAFTVEFVYQGKQEVLFYDGKRINWK